MVLRRLVAVALLGLVVVGAGLTHHGHAAGAAGVAGGVARPAPTAVSSPVPVVPLSAAPTRSRGPDRGDEPCLVRAECAGGWVVAGVGLLVALPVVGPSARRARPTAMVGRGREVSHGVRLAARLFRPPRLA